MRYLPGCATQPIAKLTRPAPPKGSFLEGKSSYFLISGISRWVKYYDVARFMRKANKHIALISWSETIWLSEGKMMPAASLSTLETSNDSQKGPKCCLIWFTLFARNMFSIPIGSMYFIFPHIYDKHEPHVGTWILYRIWDVHVQPRTKVINSRCLILLEGSHLHSQRFQVHDQRSLIDIFLPEGVGPEGFWSAEIRWQCTDAQLLKLELMKHIQCPHFEMVRFENIEKALILKWFWTLRLPKKHFTRNFEVMGHTRFLGDLPHKNGSVRSYNIS